jgi:hypothetical protein
VSRTLVLCHLRLSGARINLDVTYLRVVSIKILLHGIFDETSLLAESAVRYFLLVLNRLLLGGDHGGPEVVDIGVVSIEIHLHGAGVRTPPLAMLYVKPLLRLLT